jgi:nucleotide-binding universal stress UspA family protein
MNRTPHRETVLVGVDGTAASAAAVRWAAAEAERRHARLHAVHVVERGGPEASPLHHDVSRELELARQSIPGRVGGWVFRSGIDVDIAVSVVTGDVGDRLAREAGDAALVVIGAPDSLHHSALPLDLAHACLCQVAMVGPFGDVTYVDVAARSGARGASHARR